MGFPSKETVMQSIEDYFRHIHPISYFAFLHKASVIQGYVKGYADDAFILALCGLTSQMLGSTPEVQQQAAKWIERAQNMVLQNLERPSIFKIQVMLLIIGYKVHLHAMSSAFMLLPLAARFAFAMRLNYENPSLCWLAQEARRRVIWAIFLLDTKAAAGLTEFTTCALETIHVQLPCREEDFELDNPQVTGNLESISLQPPPYIGLFTQYIRIMNIRDRILRFTKQVAGTGKIESNPEQAVSNFESELHLFASTLPQSLGFSTRNLMLRAYSSELSQFIMIHVWWHQCHCDLYRLLFDGLQEAVSKRVLREIDPELISYCRARCLDHARALSAEIFATLLVADINIKVMDKDIAVCAYQSARIISHGFRTTAERDHPLIESVLTLVSNCSAVLNRFCANSPSALDIAREIDSTLAGRISSHSSASEPSSPAGSVNMSSELPNIPAAPRLRQVFSRHSYFRASGFIDDSSRLVAPLDSMSTDQRDALPTFSPSPRVVREDHADNPNTSKDSTGNGSDTGTAHHNSVLINTRIPSRTLVAPLPGHSNHGFRGQREDMTEVDWSNDGAYQMAWSSFDPWISGSYDQDNSHVQDFMAATWEQ
ncbi:hypothetical protein LTR84_006867 [Exophiala bonariae]|uniref:Xylanolytic transcriptional activator regulatory domain-containing protein n=1 Tax=Exophiala bonariae TaxID=1690606 RepID=A0AAV9N3K4_9EURO|nr:hypothetical protein LTR84_006867 [Exophiala bonariae]